MIAITGATGQLSRNVIENLLQEIDANQLIAVVRSPERAADLAAKGITLRQGEYGDYDTAV